MKPQPTQIAPSLLASDWSRLAEEIAAVEVAGADWLHLDVMDGNFVPEVSFGARFVETVARCSSLPLDVHLMVDHPEQHLARFVDAGASRVTFHLEASAHAHRLIQEITSLGAKSGLALNPGTSLSAANSLLEDIDLLLLMTVNPGWGGQKFIQTMPSKIAQARTMLEESGSTAILQVDGGIDANTAALCRTAGATCFVAGSAIFSAKDYTAALQALRS